MATTSKMSYGTSNQTVTCTVNSLTNNSARGSVAVDNTSNLFLDALVFATILTNTTTGTATTGYVNVYAYGTANGGSNYSDGIAGTDSAATLTSPPNVRLIGIINCVANNVTYRGGPFAVSPAFGGVMPDKWGIVIENKTGATLHSANNAVIYQGIYVQGV